MLFNSLQYILFLPAAVLIYWLLPHFLRCPFLLLASWYFYMQWNPLYITLLIFCTAITFGGAILIEDAGEDRRKKKLMLTLCLLLNLAVLGYFKYAGFAVSAVNNVLTIAHAPSLIPQVNILLPVGISFFTLQALGCLIDVYRGDIKAERNFFRYALFVSFFPQLVAGPIERSGNLMHQLKEEHHFDIEDFREGFYLLLYGLFLKMVIADRAANAVNVVYAAPESYPGIITILATFLFGLQIYCDFYGYSVIAAGSARMMGIRLMSNFEAPFLSASIKELWRRWHISLSGWFRDYLYIPLGGSRKGDIRKELNLLIVFTVSGLWHGAALSFVVWGFLNGLYQVIGDLTGIGRRKDAKGLQLFARIRTYLLFHIALVFFRAGGLKQALRIYKGILMNFGLSSLTNGGLSVFGFDRKEWIVLMLASLMLFISDLWKYLGKRPAETVLKLPFPVRYIIQAGLFFAVIIFGCYGDTYSAQQFIYFQF